MDCSSFPSRRSMTRTTSCFHHSKYIREFDCDKVPTTVYRVGGVILKKEVVFQHYEDRILIRYTLEDAHSATTLRFRPFLAFRSVRQFTHENSVASRDYQSVDNGIKTCMYAGYPDLYMQFSKKNEFIFQPDWYRGVEYPKEQERGYASNEDLYVPGYFEMDIKKGESIVFAASTSSIRTSSLKSLFDKEVDERAPRDNFFHCLVNAAHQFHNRTKKDERYILAGYPWFKCRARDTFIALPGLTLAIEEQDYFELVMKTAEKGLREFMKGKPVSVKIYEMEQPDVPLWAIWSVQQYAKEAGEEKCFNMYGKLVRDIVEYIEPEILRQAGKDASGCQGRGASGEDGCQDKGGLRGYLPQRLWLSLRLCGWEYDGLERTTEHDLRCGA